MAPAPPSGKTGSHSCASASAFHPQEGPIYLSTQHPLAWAGASTPLTGLLATAAIDNREMMLRKIFTK